ncbi:DUF4160 domain-containing protein [Prosthecobacter sp.]|uniref:DUF4160 domain-containing protein n=1 Tax=Prosthecobacter sp. TaxID=1965333 RepID=UPI003784E8ED
MPRLTRQLLQGIKLTMNFREHNPPHFHASYQGDEVAMLFNGIALVGSLPQAQLKLVSEWAILHQTELTERWNLALAGLNFTTID